MTVLPTVMRGARRQLRAVDIRHEVAEAVDMHDLARHPAMGLDAGKGARKGGP
jgi:hypothetical protein